MKQFKTLVALVVALALTLTLVGSAMAANTITINQTNTDGTAGAETYSVYKVFDVTKTDAQSNFENTNIGTSNIGAAGTATGFSYSIAATHALVTELWDTTNNQATTANKWVKLTLSADGTKYNVEWSGTNSEDAAKEFAAWLLTKKDKLGTATTLTSAETSGKWAATGSGFDDGYYLITSSLGTNLVLATTNITINTKNEYVTDTKIEEKANMSVGDTNTYYITVNLPASIDQTKAVTVHDELDEHLEFQNDVKAVDAATSNLASDVKTLTYAEIGSAYTVTTSPTDGCTFEITIPATQVAALMDKHATKSSGVVTAYNPVSVVFQYSAELLSTAAADTDYVNKEYSTYSKYTTQPTEVKVKTFDFDLKKVFTDNTNKALEATFKLYPTVSGAKGTTAIQFIDGGTVTGKDVTYVKADTNDTGASETITVKVDSTNKSLVTNVRGLEAGTYYLTEQTTADGYNLLTTDVVITIDADGNATVGAGDLFTAADSTITVTNNSGSVLPSTGGIGTTIFYIAGAVLVLGAAAIVIARRKAEQH